MTTRAMTGIALSIWLLAACGDDRDAAMGRAGGLRDAASVNGVASLSFAADWSESLAGELRAGGAFEVRYELDRLTACRGTHNGYPAWDVVANVRFLPSGERLEGSVRELVTELGRPTVAAISRPMLIRIPPGTERVELWFRNFTGAGSSCSAWDSNFGANYVYRVLPPPDDPRCLDVARETGARTEDDRMVHLAPDCLDYAVDAHFDATHCELFVEGFGDGHMGHYGIPYEWLVGYVRVRPVEGELVGVGMYTAYRDRETREPGRRYSLGEQVAAGVWKVGFPYHVAWPMGPGGVDVVADEVAFFVDVRRPSGRVERLWLSDRGKNYGVAELFARGSVREYIPYGNIEWAAHASSLFEQRWACE